VKLVLSRKGFDSASGGKPSPILEDGRLLSLPIPEPRGTFAFADLRHRGIDVGQLVCDLAPGAPPRCHLDPDIDISAVARDSQWRPAFGQSESAARHLDDRDVGVGSLFLFFGWFRQVESVAGTWRYVRSQPHLHVLWGWLRVGAILDPSSVQPPLGLVTHPHFDGRDRPGNRVYVGRDVNSGGVFKTIRESLVLTEPGRTRSHWRLPIGFLPGDRKALSYHGTPERWSDQGDHCRLASVGRGQEFVLDTEVYPDVRHWAEDLIERAG
jgi:hypothetical protein